MKKDSDNTNQADDGLRDNPQKNNPKSGKTSFQENPGEKNPEEKRFEDQVSDRVDMPNVTRGGNVDNASVQDGRMG